MPPCSSGAAAAPNARSTWSRSPVLARIPALAPPIGSPTRASFVVMACASRWSSSLETVSVIRVPPIAMPSTSESTTTHPVSASDGELMSVIRSESISPDGSRLVGTMVKEFLPCRDDRSRRSRHTHLLVGRYPTQARSHRYDDGTVAGQRGVQHRYEVA